MSKVPRRYSLEEIDAMRADIGSSYPSGVSYNMGERSREIEDQLRTYMMAGIAPSELAKKRKAQVQANIEMGERIAKAWEEAEEKAAAQEEAARRSWVY